VATSESNTPGVKRRGRRNGTDSKALEMEARRVKVYDLRLRGKTIREIAAAVGVSVQTAHADVTAVLTRIKADANDTAEQVRQLEIERLDKMLDAFWLGVLCGNEKAADVVLKVHARRAKLLGLDAPEQYDVNAAIAATVTATPATAREIMAQQFREGDLPPDADEPPGNPGA
jgi:hypothetical protein